MALILQPPVVALQPGSTATITAQCYTAPAIEAITASSNNTNVATVAGSGNTPGPVTFTVTANPNAIGGAIITFAVANDIADSGAGIPVCIVPPNPNVPNGRTSVAAIATVRRRTGYNFGEPVDTDILAMLNDGLEQVATYLEPIVVNASLPIVSPNTNTLAFPLDVERIRDANFSTGNPALGGTVVYEMQQLDYDAFIQETDSTPAGGIGGIPTIYTIITDQNGFQLIQFYPYANPGGQINLHYYKRPTLWTLPQPPAVSFTDLDSIWQEAAMLYACGQACENREDYGTGAAYFGKKYEAKIEENRLTSKRRMRKRGTYVVRDVSVGDSVWPSFMRGGG